VQLRLLHTQHERRVSRVAPVRRRDQAGPRGRGTHPGRGVQALWDRPAGPFSPGKRAQQEPDPRYALALRCRSRAAPGADHRSNPGHAADAGQGEAGPSCAREVEAGLLFCSHGRKLPGRFGHRARSAGEGRTLKFISAAGTEQRIRFSRTLDDRCRGFVYRTPDRADHCDDPDGVIAH